MTQVAVVILNYNGRNFLTQFLPSVIAHSPGAKIVVADNGSTDDSLAVLENDFQHTVTIIRLSHNLGFCGGYNAALKQVDAEIFVLLNSDVEVTPGWIEPVIGLMKNDLTIAAAQPKILSYQDKNWFEYAGAAGGFIDLLGYPFCRGRLFTTREQDHGQYNDIRPVFWATGACLFIRSKAYVDCGGLDEDFFAHMEEIDLCWQLQRKGLRVFYVGTSTVYHVGGGTLSASNPRKTFLNFRNGLTLLVKHTPGLKLMWALPLRVMLDWLAGLKFLSSGSASDCMAVFKAHVNFLQTFSSTLKKRNALKTKMGFSVGMQYRGLLPFDYFVLGKKSFRNLGL